MFGKNYSNNEKYSNIRYDLTKGRWLQKWRQHQVLLLVKFPSKRLSYSCDFCCFVLFWTKCWRIQRFSKHFFWIFPCLPIFFYGEFKGGPWCQFQSPSKSSIVYFRKRNWNNSLRTEEWMEKDICLASWSVSQFSQLPYPCYS